MGFISDSISGTTISGTTFYGDGSNLTGISTQDTFVTGGTYSNGNAFFTNNTGGTFTVSGFSEPFTGVTVDNVTITGDGTPGNPLVASLPPSGVVSVSGLDTDNTDPSNPIIQISVDGVTILGDGTPGNPITSLAGGTFTGGTVSGDTIFEQSLTANTLNISSLTGTTDRFVEVSSGGTVSATKELVNMYLANPSTAVTLLEDPSNWAGVDYTGTAITGTYQGQKHYNSTYVYEAVDDNLFIRWSRS